MSISGTRPPSGLSDERQAIGGRAVGERKPSVASHRTSEVVLPVRTRCDRLASKPLSGGEPEVLDSSWQSAKCELRQSRLEAEGAPALTNPSAIDA
jgi:hypothetical protein